MTAPPPHLQESQAPVLRRRLLGAAILMVGIYGAGTVGYYVLGGGRWPIGDCAYMTVISLTTVGYGEVLSDIHQIPHARLFTALLLIMGSVIALYSISVLTTFLVEGEFLNLRRKRRMRKELDRMSGHVIVCGAGRTGSHVANELWRSKWPLVLIDTDEDALERIRANRPGIAYLLDDATDDRTLLAAGIKRAHGVVAALADDKDNLYVVVTARDTNPDLRIVTKAVDHRAGHKLRVAGADSVVTVNQIGGLRLASEMIRPKVVTFLDTMMRDEDKNLRFEEIAIPKGSSVANKPLAESDIRRERNLLIVAVGVPGQSFTYSPGPSFILREGMTLILLGETAAVARLRQSPAFQPSDGGQGEHKPSER